jgi:hypothetical protein
MNLTTPYYSVVAHFNRPHNSVNGKASELLIAVKALKKGGIMPPFYAK